MGVRFAKECPIYFQKYDWTQMNNTSQLKQKHPKVDTHFPLIPIQIG